MKKLLMLKDKHYFNQLNNLYLLGFIIEIPNTCMKV